VHAVKEEQLSNAVAGVVGELVSDKWETKARRGRARLDDTQNAINKTLVAPYSVRAGPGAPVSIPITWDELDDPDLRSDRWDVRSAPARVAEQGDPMARVLTDAQRLPPLE
jgi:bifunctional non-homologous end joining protein LigD